MPTAAPITRYELLRSLALDATEMAIIAVQRSDAEAKMELAIAGPLAASIFHELVASHDREAIGG